MDSPCIKQTVCKVFKIFQCGKYLVAYVLNTTFPHDLIKDELIDLIERTFNREGSPYIACNDRNAFLLPKNLKQLLCMVLSKCI